MWRDYFSKAKIVGLDREKIDVKDLTGRVHVYTGLQQDRALLDKIREETAPCGFDIIIDDASHIGKLTRVSFWHLFDNHLKPGGIYAIEDWRTGYWDKWPDGRRYAMPGEEGRVTRNNLKERQEVRLSFIRKIGEMVGRLFQGPGGETGSNRIQSHDYGMVGFIKQLVDELGMDMITNPARGSDVPFRESKFERMEIYPGIVLVFKSKNLRFETL